MEPTSIQKHRFGVLSWGWGWGEVVLHFLSDPRVPVTKREEKELLHAFLVSLRWRFSTLAACWKYLGNFKVIMPGSHPWKFCLDGLDMIWVLGTERAPVQFSCSVVSDSLRPRESQHARPPCPSPTPGVHPGSRPSSQWCHPAISSSVVPLSSCPQSLPASVFSNEPTLHMRWPKYWLQVILINVQLNLRPANPGYRS